MPNLLLDRLLPELRDTELRILLILVRATTGWNREGKPTILSYRTLMRRSGRGSEAIARALASLSAKGLIHSSTDHRKRTPAKPNAPASETGERQRKERREKEQSRPPGYPHAAGE